MTTTATSQAAAESIRPHVETMRRRVAEVIADSGAAGMTDEQIHLALGMNPSSARPRRGECWAFGIITDSLGEKRATASGRKAVVWHITTTGLKSLGMAANEWAADKPVIA